MKKYVYSFVLMAALSAVFSSTGFSSERWETLRAINWVENPDNHTRVGRFGELGPYQFRPATWKMHSKKPFSLAVERSVSDEVAIKHYEWIKQAFEQAGVEVNAFNVALAWNCGVSTVIKGRAPDVSYNYAERVSNLVEVLKEGSRKQTDPENVTVETPPILEKKFEVDENAVRFRVLQNTPSFVIAAR